jgi:hypothetical protein
VITPGVYRLGVNLAQTARRETPYPRWFHPGTADANAATSIHFDGKPDLRTLDLKLPPKLRERQIWGLVLSPLGIPVAGASVSLRDDDGKPVASAQSEANGAFRLEGFAATAYTVQATLWERGSSIRTAIVRIAEGIEPIELRLILDQR